MSGDFTRPKLCIDRPPGDKVFTVTPVSDNDSAQAMVAASSAASRRPQGVHALRCMDSVRLEIFYYAGPC